MIRQRDWKGKKMERIKQIWKVSELTKEGYDRKKLLQIANSKLNSTGRIAFRYTARGDWHFIKANLDDALRSGRVARSGLIS